MTRSTTYLNPALGLLPGVVSLALLYDFLRALPRPRVGGPIAYGRLMIQDALAVVDAAGPRDLLEAALLMQVPVLLIEAREAQAMATADPDWDRKTRMQRHALALQRRGEAMQREVRRHRAALAARGIEHVAPPPFAYDLDALEAVWRDLESELPETALVPQRMEPPPGFGAVPEPKLEDRAEFEVPPQPRFQGVPKWKQAGRKFLDDLTDEELDELVAADGRGEVYDEPPRREVVWVGDEDEAAR